MKIIKENFKVFDIKAHSLRGKEFYKGILDFREKLLETQKHRIQEPEKFRCNLCGGTSGKFFLEWQEKYQLYQCDSCELVGPNIALEDSSKHINEVYNNDIYYEKFIREIHNQYDYRKNEFGSERYGYIIERLGLDPKKISLLDVGCGAGYFLSYLQDKSVNCKGLEVNPMTVRYCQERGLNVEPTDLKEEPEGAYDVIVMFDVLEHLDDPIETFKLVRRKLKPKGYLIAYTPNIHSLGYELMGAGQNTLLPFEHLCFFNQKSFEYLANKSDFSIYSVETYGFDVMDYLLMKEYEDGVPYTVNLHKMMVLLQACLDKAGWSNHFRLTLKKEGVQND